MSSEEFARLMMDGRLSRRELAQRLIALGIAAPVAGALAARVAPAGVAAATPSLARQEPGAGH